jgi:hypothetical protein
MMSLNATIFRGLWISSITAHQQTNPCFSYDGILFFICCNAERCVIICCMTEKAMNMSSFAFVYTLACTDWPEFECELLRVVSRRPLLLVAWWLLLMLLFGAADSSSEWSTGCCVVGKGRFPQWSCVYRPQVLSPLQVLSIVAAAPVIWQVRQFLSFKSQLLGHSLVSVSLGTPDGGDHPGSQAARRLPTVQPYVAKALAIITLRQPILGLIDLVLYNCILEWREFEDIVMCMCDSRRNFGLDVGFIDHF